ncbi:MAG: hypothetical protein ABRQ38_25800 [Candidatus Eremiobacterota bacterium]
MIAGKNYIRTLLICLFFILMQQITFGQSQGQWIMGIVTSISDNAFQITDNSGKLIDIGVSQNTKFIHFGNGTGKEADFSSLTENDIVTIFSTSQSGNIIALQVGFLHQGESLQMQQNSPQFNPDNRYNHNNPYNNQYSQTNPQFNPYNNQYNDPCNNQYNQNNPQFNPYNQYNPNNLPDYNQDYEFDCPECNQNYQYNQNRPNMKPPLNPDNRYNPQFNPDNNFKPGPDNNLQFNTHNSPNRTQKFNLLADYIKNNSTISDQSGVFSCELPSGWKAERGGIYIKEMSDATALCNVTVVPLKEKDMLSFAKSNDSNYEKLGKEMKNEYKKLGIKSLRVSDKNSSSLFFSYRGSDGNNYYVEQYYISAGAAVITVHLETDRQKDFSADFRKIIENFQVK